MLRLGLDPRLAALLRPPLLQRRADLLLGVVVIKLPQVGDQRPEERAVFSHVTTLRTDSVSGSDVHARPIFGRRRVSVRQT